MRALFALAITAALFVAAPERSAHANSAENVSNDAAPAAKPSEGETIRNAEKNAEEVVKQADLAKDLAKQAAAEADLEKRAALTEKAIGAAKQADALAKAGREIARLAKDVSPEAAQKAADYAKVGDPAVQRAVAALEECLDVWVTEATGFFQVARMISDDLARKDAVRSAESAADDARRAAEATEGARFDFLQADHLAFEIGKLDPTKSSAAEKKASQASQAARDAAQAAKQAANAAKATAGS